MTIAELRRKEARATVEQLREIERQYGITRESLELMKPVLIALATRSELFPRADFPVPAPYDGITYRLTEDADHRFGLFMSAGVPGKKRGVHNHTTWACIAGVHSAEHNVVYERIDDRSDPQKGSLRKLFEVTVRPGSAVAMMPDDFHTIEVLGDEASVHLHMYGISHAHLPDRYGFAEPTGGRVVPYPPSFAVGLIGAADLRKLLDAGQELAVLDVREEGVYARDGHLLLASNVPLSQLELRVPTLVPRKSTALVVYDANDGLAHLAAARLMKSGYSNVMLLEGGAQAWHQAGFKLYEGVHVPSKAFGEYIHHQENTPEITPEELKQWQGECRSLILLDSRPFDEFQRNSIPGAIDCPGVELPYRIHDLVQSPDTTIVVNCGGRTRAIMGAQTLINAGVANKVLALRDGTQGWHLAGLELSHGASLRATMPTAKGLAEAQKAASRVAKRFGVRTIGLNELKAQKSDPEKTVYLFDVRSPEEYKEGHLPGSIWAVGGQLVQTTDAFAGVRNSTVVLVDDTGVRATFVASWLIQMGWSKVFVLRDGLVSAELERGTPQALPLGGRVPSPDTVTPTELKALLDGGLVHVADLQSSLRYREGHVPGAWHVVRSRFADNLPKIQPARPLVLTSPDGLLARLAAADAASVVGAPVKVLEGGTAAWVASGLALEEGTERFTGPTDDVRYRSLEQSENVETHIRDYLQWEVDLLKAIEADPDFGFRRFEK
jgi:rhodanese-related sulfurtransferase/predicted metal-dependent enzyme (double-stranded beta helix superfamily)